jgi:hypothetical protein
VLLVSVEVAMGRLAVLYVLVLTSSVLIPCRATVYHVNPDGLGDFPTIQAAIDHAAGGDVIELGDGVFQGEGNRDIRLGGRAITVRSQGLDPAACVIDCQGTESEFHRAFELENDAGCAIEGISMINGCAQPGGAICCWDSSPIIRGCVFTGNRAPGFSSGGAVSCGGGSAQLLDCLLRENTAVSGGAVEFCASADGYVRRCIFSRNAAGIGPAVNM